MPKAPTLDIFDVCKRIDPKKPPNRTTIWRWVRAGTFPAPVKFGARARWSEAVVDAWIAERSA